MAITKILNIKRTLQKAIKYILNPEKTEESLLVSGYNCDPNMAAVEFAMTEMLAREYKGDYRSCGGSENIAHHMIQSFAPFDKITPEEAHELGKQWADEVLGGKYEYVISTHIDKGQIHNHVIFNSTSFYNHEKFHNYKVSSKIQRISDEICTENNLYVIPKKHRRKGKSHYEWEQDKKNNSWKSKIEKNIVDAIVQANNYENFLEIMEQKGVEVANAYEDQGSHIKFRLEGQTRFSRGNNIGYGYSRNDIKRLIHESIQGKHKSKLEKDYAYRVGYESRKTKYEKTKELAMTLSLIRQQNINQLSDFNTRIEEAEKNIDALDNSTETVGAQLQEYKRVAKYLNAYQKHFPIYEQAYKNNPFKRKAYIKVHENELQQFEFALEQLQKLNISCETDIDKVMELIEKKEEDLSRINARVIQSKQSMKNIKKARDITSQIFDGERPNLQIKKEPTL